MSQHSHNSYPILWSFGIPSLHCCGTNVDDEECKLVTILSSLAKSPNQYCKLSLKSPEGGWIITYLQFTIYNLHYYNIVTTFLLFWNPYEPLSYALSFFCPYVSTFPLNSFQSLRSLWSASRSAGLGYRGLWGRDCFFFDNNELERILWSFDAQSSILLNELSKMLWECWQG